MKILNLQNEAASAYYEEQYKCIDSITKEEAASRKLQLMFRCLECKWFYKEIF